MLHDSHAEVIARRGLVRWLFGQLERAGRGEESVLYARDGSWAMKEEFVLGLYVSTLPCQCFLSSAEAS